MQSFLKALNLSRMKKLDWNLDLFPSNWPDSFKKKHACLRVSKVKYTILKAENKATM